MSLYRENDKVCPHCGGNIELHSLGDGAGFMRWCDRCGSNNPDKEPSVTIETHPRGPEEQ